SRGGNSQREMHKVICASCGKETMVPFKPSGDRPVYCRDCYQEKNNRY
ncbi:MAG: CxxC-x17-CxxC domain-containing protein, partial [Gammaproteobacteria bacterium]